MAGNSYTAWEGGAEFVESLRANKAQLEAFMSQHTPEERRQMADGLAEYLTQAVARDPNALPMGLSESLDSVREGKSKGGKVTNALKGIKNDFYNLFDKHPNVMLTTGGIVGLGGGLSLLKHYGLDKGTKGGMLTSVGNMIFQSEKLVTLSTGPFSKKLAAEDNSISGQLADALDGKVPEGGNVPEGMDPNSPEGKMVKESSKSVGSVFQNMVRHREMLISNILVAGETFQTGGFVTDAFLDRKHIASQTEEQRKGQERTAKGGMINAASNTLLMGLTYYNQYIDPKLQELDKNSPDYKEQKAQIWKDAPSEHMFKPGRICGKVIGAMPDKLRGLIPNTAIACSFLPLTGMVMEGMKGGKDGGVAPYQLFGSLAVMANVIVNYTAITNRSKGQKILAPDEVTEFANVVAEAAKQHTGTQAVDAGEVMGLKDMLLSQSFVAPEHEGIIEQKLAAAFDLPFAAVRDHSRKMPTSQEPVVLSSSHGVTKAVMSLGAAEGDITAEGATLKFDDAPEATRLAVDTINALAKNGSHIAKSFGGLQAQPTADGKVELKMQVRALPALANAVKVLAAEPDVKALSPEQVTTKVQQALQTTPPLLHLAPQPQAGQGIAAR